MTVAVIAAALSAALLCTPRHSLPVRRTSRAAPRPSPALLGCAAGVLAALLFVPFPLALLAALALGALGWRWVSRLEPAAVRRRRGRLEAALPEVVDLMSTCLASGMSPTGGLARVAQVLEAPMREELASYCARLDLGADPVDVWAAMAAHPQLGPLGRSLRRSADTGSSVADGLVGLSAELRSQRRAATEARARAVEVKASLPLGLCLLPAFVLIGIVPMVAGSFSLTFLGS